MALSSEFRRPASAKSVTLVFRAKPTPWAAELWLHVLALQGRDYPAWYARMNDDASARAEYLTALRREGHLAVQLWDGIRWRSVGVVPAHEAMDLQLDGIPGDMLRLRLLTTPGLWRVDGVQADFGPEAPLDAIELPIVEARTGEGTDVRELLVAADGRRLVMKRGDSVDIVAAVPPPRPGRSVDLLPEIRRLLHAAGPGHGRAADGAVRETAQGARGTGSIRS